MAITEYIQAQAQRHPALQPQDVVKLCYQSAFGAEHLLQDTAAALAYFETEFAAVSKKGEALCESIGPDFMRVNLAAWKEQQLPPRWLFNLFAMTAAAPSQKIPPAQSPTTTFQHALAEAETFIKAGAMPFTIAAWHNFLDSYRQGGIQPVHHSAAYRTSEQPAYRVVCRRIARLIPLLQKLAQAENHFEVSDNSGTFIITIEGRAASGKSTMAAQLAEIIGAGVIHMDDFFLPQSLRTTSRLAEPGGNVHYERFTAEVLPHLRSEKAFQYRCFDCETMDYGIWRPVAASRWRIVEGAYSNHPYFGAYMHLRAFSDIAPEIQIQRLRQRNGTYADVFVSRWIPMEEAYIRAYHIAENADLVL